MTSSDLQRSPRLLRARSLRSAMTDEERLLWSELKTFRRAGYAFRKQAVIGPFVADFLCRKVKLIVEVDGAHHDTPEQMAHDARRDAWLRSRGYTVVRYDAADVWRNIDSVVEGIEGLIRDLV